MANKITTLFDFKENGSGLKKIKADIQGVDGAWNKAKTGFKSAVGEFRSSNAAQGAAIAGLGAGALKAIGYASDLEESVNAVTVTYGENADAVLAIGENAAKSFGMSKAEFNGFAVQFSAFAKQIAERDGRQVSEVIDDMAGRVADFASVMNLDLNTAAQVFMSTMAGETEPIRRFGKDVSAAAVEAYALSKGLIETKDQLTEAVKVQARYGLLMEQTNDVQGDFANTSDSLANSQRILSAEAKDLAAELGTTLGPALATVVSGLTDIIEVADKLKLTDAVSLSWVETFGTNLGKVLTPWKRGAREANQEVVDAFESAERAAASFDMTLLDGAKTFGEARAIALEYANGVEDVGDAEHAANTIALKWNQAQAETNELTAEGVEITSDYTKAQNLVETAIKQARYEVEHSNKALDKAKQFAQRAAEFVQNLGTKWDQLKGKMSDRSAFLDVEDAFDTLQVAAEEAWTAAEDGADDAEQKARDAERAMIDLKNKVIDYATEVGNVPDQVVSNIFALIDQGKLAEAEAALDALERSRRINYYPIIHPTRAPGGNDFMASGGRSAGGPTVVGERGPELVDLPRGARVRSASETITDTRNGGSSPTFITQIMGNVYGVDHLQQIMDERDRRLLGQLRQGRRG